MKTKAILVLLLGLVFYGCEKDDDAEPVPAPTPPVPTTPPANTIAEFTMFHAGNYWVYENYKIDSNGLETLEPQVDSAYYKGDTLINGDTCHIIHHWWLMPTDWYLKDSAGYLVANSYIYLTTAIANDTFYTWQSNDSMVSTPYANYKTVDSLLTPVTVPAGTFNHILDVADIWYYNPASVPVYNPIILHTRYAKSIGKISEQYAFMGELYQFHAKHERRLVRYHVN